MTFIRIPEERSSCHAGDPPVQPFDGRVARRVAELVGQVRVGLSTPPSEQTRTRYRHREVAHGK
jgi:hypothetical protein